MAAICPAAHQPKLLFDAPTIRSLGSPHATRLSYGLLQTPQVARQRIATGSDAYSGEFQPALSGWPPVSDRHPGKLVVLRALRQELVSRLRVPNYMLCVAVRIVDNIGGSG